MEEINQVIKENLGICWRCTSVSLVGQIRMNGNYTAHLCAHCCNEWEIYARNHHLVIELDQLGVLIDTMINQTCADGQDRSDLIFAAIQAERKVRNKLFSLAEEWIKAK